MAQTNATLIWNIAELLRGPYQPNQYGEPGQGPVDDDVAEIDRERLVTDLR
jgi:hypothetical protein